MRQIIQYKGKNSKSQEFYHGLIMFFFAATQQVLKRVLPLSECIMLHLNSFPSLHLGNIAAECISSQGCRSGLQKGSGAGLPKGPPWYQGSEEGSNLYCSAVQCHAVQCILVQCGAVQCRAMQCSGVQQGALQCSTVHCIVVQYCAVQCSAVQCSALHYAQYVLVQCINNL